MEVLIVLVVLFIMIVGLFVLWIFTQEPPSVTAAALNQRLASVRHMSGLQFERFVADVMRELGYRTQVLGGSGDQGVDVIATGGGERIAVQCKNYARPVGNKLIQEVFAGAKHHRCTRAMVVAPMGFTKGAVALARSVDVDLCDSKTLRGWIKQIQPRAQERGPIDLDEIDRKEGHEAKQELRTVDLDQREGTMASGAKKQTVKVGSKDPNSTVGETAAFTADRLGTAKVNGGAEDGGADYTFYRLPDGTFRVLAEAQDIAMLVPSDMQEAMSRGQRNHFSYGRMTLEEMKAHPYNFGEAYEALMKVHPETVRNTVRDID